MSISINKKWECSGQIQREPRSHDENICHTEWQEFARVFSCDLYYISTESITLRDLNFTYSIGNEGNVLMLNLFHISTVTCEKEHHLSYTHNSLPSGFFFNIKRQLIVNSSQNFLTYLSGENMGRRPSSGPSQSPPVVKVRRGTPAPLQCHQCQALFLSLSQPED